MRTVWNLLILTSLSVAAAHAADFNDKQVDRDALPTVPAEFEVTLFAREPLVRQPCSMAFDERGRLFVGMGPQYRNPTPETPSDSVVLVLDTDGDGRADRTKEFATGFNAVQGLAWHGRDLWIANSPDLTVVRDLNGDDEADEYVKIYTDLGNLEHGLHGLNWAPDGKLYMSKGNSKGLNQPGRFAPKPFRDLWGVTAPATVPDFPAPVTTGKHDYRRAYHDPADDWGLDGGVLRCDDGGRNLEIVSRGFRNPWDITFDSGFHWIGTDNDQTTGDRVFMPFYGAHFGWNHPWSSHWGTDPHAPTAPVSGPLFEGSGTGVVFCQSPQFPPKYRGTFLVNDWLLKTTYLWRPRWDGALLRPAGGGFIPFIEGGKSLFRPTDLEFGPDGALWVLGWSSGYGAEWKDGQLTNEGRIFRVAWKNAPAATPLQMGKRLSEFTIDELLAEFDSPLPVRRINAQDEVVRRGSAVQQSLIEELSARRLSENQLTWTVWALGRMPDSESIANFLNRTLATDSQASLNLQIQAVRILGHRAKQFRQTEPASQSLQVALIHEEPRVRIAAVQAVHEAAQTALVPELLELLQRESDATVFYAGWQALRRLRSTAELRALLGDSRAAVRRAALLALLETHAATPLEVRALAKTDTDVEVRHIAELWLTKSGDAGPAIRGRSLQAASTVATTPNVAAIRHLKTRNGAAYKVVPGGFANGTLAYTDRDYRLNNVPPELAGADLIQTANNDDNSRGEQWLSAEALVPVHAWVGIDFRQKTPPGWVLKNFQKEPFTATISEGARFAFYSRTFDTGRVELGGNTDDGSEGGKGNYVIAIAPLPIGKQPTKSSVDATLALLERGDRDRGELLFRHARGAGCAKCHSLDQSKNGFGPNLGSIGLRSNARHIVQSIVEPSAVITEGFNQLTVVTNEGQVFSGVLLEESGLTLSLGQSNGERIDIPKASIDERKTSPQSAMPEMADHLTPQQIADLATFLLTMQTPVAAADASTKTPPSNNHPAAGGFGVEEQKDRLCISLSGKPIVDFVFRDDKILRPYFANARLTSGVQVTRNHPPVKDLDATDHDTMHPGIWLGLGDISGHDFWRNKASMEHVRFVSAPKVVEGRLRFATECRLKTNTGEQLGLLVNDFTLAERPNGWLLAWSATFRAVQRAIVFGDQEEMGFGARIATPFIEKNGGVLLSATGKQTAKETWGQPAAWCDYSGTGPDSGGILLMAGTKNFRESWWHNRDYGVFVANPFGRQAMKQGARSEITVAPGETLQVTFGALIHDHREFDRSAEFQEFSQIIQGVAREAPRTTHDPNLYLFVDDHWIEKQEGIQRVYNQARPLDKPIIWPDDPKTETDCAWGNVIRETDGRYRLWYATMTMGHNNAGPHEIASAEVWGRGDDFTFRPRSAADRPAVESMLGKYAESADGITWKRPKLGMFEYRGGKANNIVLTGHLAAKQTGGALTNFDGYTILRDERETDPARRYKMVAHWESVHFWDNHAVSGSLGRPQEFIDRCAQARGEYITYSPDGLRWEQPLERLPTLPTSGGDRLLVVPDHRNHRWLAYVRAGGWSYPSFSHSEDLLNWSAAEPARRITPEFVKAPAVECMIPFNYGNQDLGFPCGMDKPKGEFTVMLASRHANGEWAPVNLPASLIPQGPPGSYYATGAVPLHNEPFVAGDEMLIYFNAFSRNQAEPCPFGTRSIGVATMRRDGFVGLQCSHAGTEGTLTTKPMAAKGEQLQLNVELRGGEGAVTVALLDEQGNELPGFTFADSIPITDSAVRTPARWKAAKDISSLRDKPVRVALRLEGRAILYALAFTESQE